MAAVQIRALYIYPVKSCAGIRVKSAEATARGLAHDRRFMLVDPEGMFVTQREVPMLSQVSTRILGANLRLRWGGQVVSVPLQPDPLATRKGTRMVTVWSARVRAQEASAAANAMFSELAGRPLALVYMPDTTRRRVDARYAGARNIVSFADGFPLLVASTSSLADLNTRLDAPVTMARFRPNLEVDGLPAWAEDSIAMLDFGTVQFALVKPCSRCIMVNVVPDTGRVAAEPLRALARFRTTKHRVIFGQNALIAGAGTLAVGDIAARIVKSTERPPKFNKPPPKTAG